MPASLLELRRQLGDAGLDCGECANGIGPCNSDSHGLSVTRAEWQRSARDRIVEAVTRSAALAYLRHCRHPRWHGKASDSAFATRPLAEDSSGFWMGDQEADRDLRHLVGSRARRQARLPPKQRSAGRLCGLHSVGDANDVADAQGPIALNHACAGFEQPVPHDVTSRPPIHSSRCATSFSAACTLEISPSNATSVRRRSPVITPISAFNSVLSATMSALNVASVAFSSALTAATSALVATSSWIRSTIVLASRSAFVRSIPPSSIARDRVRGRSCHCYPRHHASPTANTIMASAIAAAFIWRLPRWIIPPP